MYDYDKLIDLVVEKRKEKGWYQYDLANAVYRNARIISRIESKRNVVKLDTFLLMLDALDCEIEIRPRKKSLI